MTWPHRWSLPHLTRSRHSTDLSSTTCSWVVVNPVGEAGFNLARVVAILSGLETVRGTTVNRFCSSSLQTTGVAFHAIRSGGGGCLHLRRRGYRKRVLQGAPDSLPDTQNPVFDRSQQRTADLASTGETWTDPRIDGALPDAYIAMGPTAENVARTEKISREEQDASAARSQKRAERAREDGFWAREITPKLSRLVS